MKVLLDTHLLLWAATNNRRLPKEVDQVLADDSILPCFSTASLWEVSIKFGLGRSDFTVDPRVLRRGLLDQDYLELPIIGAHAVAVADLPMLHKDPFDRLLIAQAMVEGITFMTVDQTLAHYPGPIRLVQSANR